MTKKLMAIRSRVTSSIPCPGEKVSAELPLYKTEVGRVAQDCQVDNGEKGNRDVA